MNVSLESEIEIAWASEAIVLRGDAAAFLPRHETLLVADLHLGKDHSFRAAGIPVPRGINEAMLDGLSNAIESSNAKSLLILGDLIHDQASLTDDLIAQVAQWRSSFPQLQITLVRGNHDRHVKRFPESWAMKEVLQAKLGSVELIHEVSGGSATGKFQIGGHLHPAVFLGRGADRTRFPCFAISDRSIVMPAFGAFKGGQSQKRAAGMQFFPICEGRIWKA